jgi:flagellar hook-basal body complex protein FliE
MAGITPVSGIFPQMPSATPSAARSGEAGGGFSDLMKSVSEKVDKEQQSTTNAVQDLLTGRNEDVLPVVSAVARADMSFKLLIGVRNKVIEAYKQTLNMQV